MESLNKIKEFVREVMTEFKRVTWPSRPEIITSTSVVILLSVVVAVFLWVVDIGLSTLVRPILR